MPVEVAAAFPVGAQTAFSIIRRAGIGPGANVLITAATSNTSLFVISALAGRARVYGTTSKSGKERELRDLGVTEVIRLHDGPEFIRNEGRIAEVVRRSGGFNCVIDPFADLYSGPALDVLSFGGKYITCGFMDQYTDLTGAETSRPAACFEKERWSQIILRNLQIVGNCLGSSADLSDAIERYQSGSLPVTIDSIHQGSAVAAFFSRTFSDPDRFGKVVYRYD
jgi:NADPH:quinone reductase-like Zn-dependent oxidoreductase